MQGGEDGSTRGTTDEAASIVAAREAQLDIIPSMRRLIVGVCALRRIPQARLASLIGWSPPKLAQFMSGKRNGRDITRLSMINLQEKLVVGLDRANLPTSEQALKQEADLLATAAARHAVGAATALTAAAGVFPAHETASAASTAPPLLVRPPVPPLWPPLSSTATAPTAPPTPRVAGTSTAKPPPLFFCFTIVYLPPHHRAVATTTATAVAATTASPCIKFAKLHREPGRVLWYACGWGSTHRVHRHRDAFK